MRLPYSWSNGTSAAVAHWGRVRYRRSMEHRLQTTDVVSYRSVAAAIRPPRRRHSGRRANSTARWEKASWTGFAPPPNARHELAYRVVAPSRESYTNWCFGRVSPCRDVSLTAGTDAGALTSDVGLTAKRDRRKLRYNDARTFSRGGPANFTAHSVPSVKCHFWFNPVIASDYGYTNIFRQGLGQNTLPRRRSYRTTVYLFTLVVSTLVPTAN